jgi:glycosyltransferase involved in cell wall biosynthesis
MTRDKAQRLRILHVITRLVVGGAQENTLLTVTRLDRVKYEVTLASGPTAGPEGSLEDHLPPTVAFERIPELVRYPHPVTDLLAIRRLYRLMLRDRYHIVHTHTTKAGIVGRIAARLARVPIVIHTPHGHAFHAYLNRVGSEALKWVERSLARRTDQIVCLTPAERDDHLRYRIGGREQFEIIHSGVDVDRFKQVPIDAAARRRAVGLPASGPLIGCVARLVPVKGVEYLLEATPALRAAAAGATVVVVGDGPLRPELERRAHALGLDGTVVFLGLRRDVPDLMPLFDLLVLPSLNEGMGRVAVEALAAGRPVVGSRVSGIQDIVADGQTGLLVPPADPHALAAAIIRCLGDPEQARAMGRRGQAKAREYSIEAMMAKIEGMYERWADARQLERPFE